MTKEMVISANRHETKVAILEDDQLVEVHFQRANEYSLAGSIHKGRVTRVLPGMQSAFVDLGLDRDTFLYVSDFFEEEEDIDQVPLERESRPGREPRHGREERSRDDRPRDDRPVRVEPVAPPEQAEPADRSTPDAATEPPAETPPVTAVDRGARSDRPDSRDQDRDRNRRSRRRRNRGRGFPESKYASPSASPLEKPASEESEPAQAEAAEPAADFSVLPGESLAKYRHATVPVLDSGEQEEIEAASAVAEHTLDQATPEEVEEEAANDESPDEPGEPAVPPTSGERETPALARQHPKGGVSAVQHVAAPSSFEEETTAAEAAPPALADELDDIDIVDEAEMPPAIASEDDVADSVDLEPDRGPEVEAGARESVGSSEGAAQAGEPAAGQPSEPLTAAVREHGGRYLQHRASRRMRRRTRGPDRGDGGRRESEPRQESTAPPAAPPAETFRSESRPTPRAEKGATPSITDLLKEGQEILVQIAKEPLGQKGARITSHIALPGRFVVYMPTLEHMGVSRKIASDEERLRLKRILQAHRPGVQGGFIVRTAGEGKPEDEIAADMNFLANLWIDIRQKAEKRPAPLLLHHDLDIVQRLLRDQFTDNFKAIWVDSEDVYESILRFVQRFQPPLVSRIKLYTRPAPIFDAFSITQELEKALRPKVWLKSGGYIVINQTEALVAINVNTGKFVGKSNRLEDTIVKTNTEAVKEIVRQVRLRDLGGIIVVDFIDMDERKNRQKVMQTLEEAMRADKAPYKILQFNDFGLVAITRKRVKQSLERALCSPCPYCEGAGYVKSVQTTVSEILQEAHKIAKAVEDEANVVLRVNPEVAKVLKSTQNRYLEELEEILRRPVLVKSDASLHHEKFDLA